MNKRILVGAAIAASSLAGCDRTPEFPEVLMTYRDTDWLKANEDRIPEIVAECDEIMNSELRRDDLPIPVWRNCGSIKSNIASIERSRALEERRARAAAAARGQ
ncbi:hypothetical protein ABVV53_13725 [Novosphingobium sp. RD2P27]|uniref:UrcA family protein n=1 Tax=Novosphingobium kalidii TaxID=3230299 RepID=A0ABV2D3Q9_9SPHN